jgi:hypothetical protein
MYEITRADLAQGRKLKIGAIAAPVVLTTVPAAVTLLLTLLFSSGPPVAAVILFVGIIATILGFLIGITLTGVLAHRRSVWTKEMREKIAADGIRAEEIDWFQNELKASEKRALKAISARDALMGDAYRDTLASRLTATRIVRSSKRELLLAKRRQNSLKQLKSARAEDFRSETSKDIQKISNINEEAKLMLSEAEARLHMIEGASARGGTLADSELALKKLSARASELPLALESAKMTDQIKKELTLEGFDPDAEFEKEEKKREPL